MDEVLDIIERVAPSHTGILIEGESGTGKELVARAVHGLSGRTSYVALNCAALPESLLESELFGHERGAFTGADRARVGLFVQASGGTLFLDEVSEATPAIQAKLLRVLQDKEVRPLGTNASRRVDVRIVAASNANLREACDQGTFRKDLYHRLAVLPIRLPALRERIEDVPVLIEHFLKEVCEEEGKRLAGIDGDAMRLLEQYRWPGNVRELQNEVRRMVICARDAETIRSTSVGPWISEGRSPSPIDRRALREVLREIEVATILSRLQQHGYRRAATARSLGITREALWAKLRQLGLYDSLPRRDRPVDEAAELIGRVCESLDPPQGEAGCDVAVAWSAGTGS